MGAVYETGEYEPDEVDLALASPSLAGELCGTGHVARPDVTPSIRMIATSVNSMTSAGPRSPGVGHGHDLSRSGLVHVRPPQSPAAESGQETRSWTCAREINAELTSKYGFSVVAEIKVSSLSSTAGGSASCWGLSKRWISSRETIVFMPVEVRRWRTRSPPSPRPGQPARRSPPRWRQYALRSAAPRILGTETFGRVGCCAQT